MTWERMRKHGGIVALVGVLCAALAFPVYWAHKINNLGGLQQRDGIAKDIRLHDHGFAKLADIPDNVFFEEFQRRVELGISLPESVAEMLTRMKLTTSTQVEKSGKNAEVQIISPAIDNQQKAHEIEVSVDRRDSLDLLETASESDDLAHLSKKADTCPCLDSELITKIDKMYEWIIQIRDRGR